MVLLVLLAALAAVLVGILGNWIYDLLSVRDILPARPGPKRLAFGLLIVLILIGVGVLPELVSAGGQGVDNDATGQGAENGATSNERERLDQTAAALSSDDIIVRTRAIQELKEIGDRVEQLRDQVAVTLAAFVRDRSTYAGEAEFPDPLWQERTDVNEAMRVLAGPGFVSPDLRLDLHAVNIRRIEIDDMRADFSHVNLADARADAESHLPGVSFKDAILTGAHFDHAVFSDADLRGVTAVGAVFKDVDLRGAQFDSGSDLTDSCLIEANLEGATGLELADLTGARANNETEWPEGFDVVGHGVEVVPTDGCFS